MSWPELRVRHHRLRTDVAIHEAYVRLAAYPTALERFTLTLHRVRTVAPGLLEAPIRKGHHLGVESLIHLSLQHHAQIRSVTNWKGASGSWYCALSSLARHLMCKYRVPAFLTAVWYADDALAESKRRWFLQHARGTSFRSLDLPIVLTRRMEHLFLASADHLSIEGALRIAELAALGLRPVVIDEVMKTRRGNDLNHSGFWRTVWLFLKTNSEAIDLSQIAPLLDYLHTIRHQKVSLETLHGTVEVEPQNPNFSMKGRTVQSLLRAMERWHRSLAAKGPALSWPPSSLQPYLMEEPPRDGSDKTIHWQIVELTNSTQLRREGAALHHCVATYGYLCCRGLSSIWSIRRWNEGVAHPVLTIEINPIRKEVVQARGRANRPAAGKALEVLQHWVNRERLQLTI